MATAFPLVIKSEERRRLNVEDAWRVYGHGAKHSEEGADYFYARIPIGNPPQHMDFIVDSGSSLPYIPCETDCEKCGKHTHPYYNYEQSKTYKQLACTEKFCNRFQCLIDENVCKFGISYMEGSSVSGHWISETISMKKNRTVRVNIGCIRKETKLIYGQDADGILGIADKDVSLSNQILLDPIYENTLNLCFAHDGGFIEFGREHIPQNLVYTKWHHGNCRKSWYKLKTKYIEIGGEKLLDEGHKNYESNGYCGTVFDTGSSDILFGESALWDAFTNVLKKNMKFTKVKSGLNLCFTHSDFEVMKESVPTLTIHFEGEVKIEVPFENLFYVKPGKKLCTSVYNEGEGIMIGGSALKNNYVSIDKKNDRIGIIQTDCKKFADQIGVDHVDVEEISPGAQKVTYVRSSPKSKMVKKQKHSGSNKKGKKILISPPQTTEEKKTFDLLHKSFDWSKWVTFFGIFYILYWCVKRRKRRFDETPYSVISMQSDSSDEAQHTPISRMSPADTLTRRAVTFREDEEV